MKKISILLFSILYSTFSLGQINEDFESGNIDEWQQTPVERWAASSWEPISGNYSLHHIFTTDITDNYQNQIARAVSPALDQGEVLWQFQIKYTYNPSSSNHWGIYLFSDADASQMTPDAAANGYVLGVNLASSDDIVKLWKKNSGSLTEILSTGINWQDDITANTAGFEVTRSQTGNWTIKIDTNGNFDNLQHTGSVTDNTLNTANYFGVYYAFTKSATEQFWFDNFTIIDASTPPSLSAVNAINSDTIELFYTKAVTQQSAETITNYLLKQHQKNIAIQNITLDTENPKKVILETETLSTGNYTLTVRDIDDVNGNKLTEESIDFTFIIPAAQGDVVINEIMADPNPVIDNLPEQEYIELYNSSENTQILNQWKLSIGTGTVLLPLITLDAGEYVILCDSESAILFETYGKVTGVDDFPTLPNSGKKIELKSAEETVISSLHYTTEWYNDSDKDDGGWSLEKIDPENNCSGITNWKASESPKGGTPGTQNSVFGNNPDNTPPKLEWLQIISADNIKIKFSENLFNPAQNISNYSLNPGDLGIESIVQSENSASIYTLFLSEDLPENQSYQLSIRNISDKCGNINNEINKTFTYYIAKTGDIVINEIMPDPVPQVNLPEAEFIELYNTTNFEMNLSNWSIIVDGSEKTFGNAIVPPNDYLVLCHEDHNEAFSEVQNIYAFSGFPTLLNSGTSIIIKDDKQTIVDSIFYSLRWYRNSEKEDGGWSLERIDPDNTCGAITNWKASENENGGTPGYINSIYAKNTDTLRPFVEFVRILNKELIFIQFSEPITKESIINTNFSITGNTSINSAQADEENPAIIYLTLSQPLEQGSNFELNISHLSDYCGNKIETRTSSHIYYVAQAFDVVINEILSDESPAIELPEYEFIEIYNRSNYKLDLTNWKIIAGTTSRNFPLSFIAPKQYVILCDKENTSEFEKYGAVIGIEHFPSITNSGQYLILKSNQGKIISAVNFSDAWYQNEYKAEGGWSLEQIDFENPCGQENNWKASQNNQGGTPGKENSIYTQNPDLSTPELTRITLLSNDSLWVFFNEPLDSSSYLNPIIYEVDKSIGSPDTVIPIPPFYSSIKLKFPTPFEQFTRYTLTVIDSVKDCAGNQIDIQQNTAQFEIPQPAEENDLVINEVMFNPFVGSSDFVELYNRSTKTIDLQTLRLANRDEFEGTPGSVKSICEQGWLLFPGQYLALTEDAIQLKKDYYCKNENTILEMESLPTYPNDEGVVWLLDKTLDQIDYFEYNEDMHFPLLSDYKGVSLERLNPDRPTEEKTNWHSAAESVGFATPGYKNSQYTPQAETQDEISVEPEIFSPDNDGYKDVVNINYQFNQEGYVINITIYDSSGRLVKRLVKNELTAPEGSVSWDGTNMAEDKVKIGIYIIFVETFHPNGDVKHFKKICVVGTRLD